MIAVISLIVILDLAILFTILSVKFMDYLDKYYR